MVHLETLGIKVVDRRHPDPFAVGGVSSRSPGGTSMTF